MKKIALTFASITFMFLTACAEEKERVEVIEKTVIGEKEVEVPVKVEEEKPGTSISVGKDGVEFSTKDKKKDIEVEIKKD